MTSFTFAVTVETDTLVNAKRVLSERLGHDEDYGFDYEVDWLPEPLTPRRRRS